jgi:hypothetical protein
MVEVGDVQFDAELFPQTRKDMQQADGVRPAGNGEHKFLPA